MRLLSNHDDVATALWMRALALRARPDLRPEEVSLSISDLYELMKAPYRPRARS